MSDTPTSKFCYHGNAVDCCDACDREETIGKLKSDLAAALERAKSAGEDAFKLRVDLASAQDALAVQQDELDSLLGTHCGGDCLAAPCSHCDGTHHVPGKLDRLREELEEAQEANAQLVKERDAAFAMSRCECQSEECCRNLVQSQEARQRAEALAEANAKDAERLQYLIDNAYSGLDEDLEEPMAVGMIVGGKVEWPDGVRRLIDAAIDAAREGK